VCVPAALRMYRFNCGRYMANIVVSGAIANKPFNGGATWTRLSYVLGLRDLGHNVFFIEQIDAKSCVGADGTLSSFADSANLNYFRTICQSFQLQRKAALISVEDNQIDGAERDEVLEVLQSALLLINISGHLKGAYLAACNGRKAYLDLDPGFTQMWAATSVGESNLTGHDVYFTVGENIGHPICSIPTNGIHWLATRQPGVSRKWPITPPSDPKVFSTIASWRGPYGPVRWENQTYGPKAHEFRKFLSLPCQTHAHFCLALDIHPADSHDREQLLRHRWEVRESRTEVSDPFSFRRFVQRSAAEFSVAQPAYVHTKSGWFSDRSVRYLFSGKPVLVQDTGFSRNYPIGQGIVPFSNLTQAVTGVENILQDYDSHAAAARAIAEKFFDSRLVLNELLERSGV
jgi:hypothetical protein